MLLKYPVRIIFNFFHVDGNSFCISLPLHEYILEYKEMLVKSAKSQLQITSQGWFPSQILNVISLIHLYLCSELCAGPSEYIFRAGANYNLVLMALKEAEIT